MKEEYQTTGELIGSKVAAETRSLILERLPLFLHEHTHAATRVPFTWLAANKNFGVRAFGKLGVVKSLHHGNLNVSRKQDASAVAQRSRSGLIELWIAGNAQVDMYEYVTNSVNSHFGSQHLSISAHENIYYRVATSLNRLIFDTPKANDALLFMTILSTDLRSLKRRGYNGKLLTHQTRLTGSHVIMFSVDRILRQQRDVKLVAESARLGREQEVQPVPGSFDALDTVPEMHQNQAPVSERPSSPSSVNTFQNLRRKIGSMASSQTEKLTSIANQLGGKPGVQLPVDDHNVGSTKPPLLPPKDTRPPISTPSKPGSAVTPLSNICRSHMLYTSLLLKYLVTCSQKYRPRRQLLPVRVG